MASRNQTLIDTVGMDVVAHASSEGPDNQLRWTELAVFHRPGERRPFVGQSVGRTKVRGETDFFRQRVGKSIEEVCRMFDNSRLHDEITKKAQAWLDAHPELVAASRAAPSIQFDGAGGLRGALSWLYDNVGAPDLALANWFERDWGVPARSVRHTLKQERDGESLPPWCKAFLGALQHFDRDAFHDCRRP